MSKYTLLEGIRSRKRELEVRHKAAVKTAKRYNITVPEVHRIVALAKSYIRDKLNEIDPFEDLEESDNITGIVVPMLGRIDLSYSVRAVNKELYGHGVDPKFQFMKDKGIDLRSSLVERIIKKEDFYIKYSNYERQKEDDQRVLDRFEDQISAKTFSNNPLYKGYRGDSNNLCAQKGDNSD